MESAKACPDQPGLPGEPLHTLTRRMALTSLPLLLLAAGTRKDHPMPWSSVEAVRARLVVVYGTGPNEGVFVYSGTPALGNPPIFWASANLADPYGNTLKGNAGAASQGFYVVGNAGQADTTIGGGSVTWRSSSITQNGFIQVPAAGADYLQIQAPLISGDTDAAKIQLNSGTAGASSTVLFPYGNFLKAANPSSGLAETWHPLTLAAGWSAVAGYATPAYRINALGDVQMAGRITGTAGTGSNTLTGANLPSGYFSASNSYTVPCSVSASAGLVATTTPRLTLTNTGAVNLNGISTSGTTVVDLAAAFPVSAG